jgi:hypothetical protein
MDDALLLKTRRALAEALACRDELRSRRPTCIDEAFAARAFPFDRPLVRTHDLVERFGGSKETVTAFLRSKGAAQLPRTPRVAASQPSRSGRSATTSVSGASRLAPAWRST